MKTITQLAKAARRIPKIIKRAMKNLTGGKKLTALEVQHWQSRLSGAHFAYSLLAQEIKARNIGGVPFRDCTPWRLRQPAA